MYKWPPLYKSQSCRKKLIPRWITIVGNNKRCILYTRSNYIDNQFTIPTNVIQKTKTVSFNSDAFFQ